MWNPRKSGATLALLLAFTACEAPPKAIGQGRLPAQRRSAQVALGSFTATVDPSAPAGTAQLLELPIQRDGLSGLNSPFTIEVYSPLPARLVTASPNCGGLDTFEGAVRIKNYFQEQLSNVYVEFTDIHGGASTVCNKMAIAPDINSTLNVTPGILDYTNGGDPSAFDVSHLGVYNTDRTANGAGKIVPNGDSSTLPTGDRIWAFPVNASRSPFTYSAHVVGDIRPAAAALESAYVDAGGAIYVFSYDTADPAGYGTDPGIAEQVNIQLYIDAAMTTVAGAQLSATVDRLLLNPNQPGTGSANTGSNTTGRVGSTLYVKLQNQWTSPSSSPLYGVRTPDPSGATVLVTRATTANTGLPGVANTTFPMSTDTHAAGAEIEVRDGTASPTGTRLTSCTGSPNPLTLPQRATGNYQWDFGGGPVIPSLPTVFPRTDPGLGGVWTLSNNTFVSNHIYCYRVRNLFVGVATGGTYPGAWSTWGSFRGP